MNVWKLTLRVPDPSAAFGQESLPTIKRLVVTPNLDDVHEALRFRAKEFGLPEGAEILRAKCIGKAAINAEEVGRLIRDKESAKRKLARCESDLAGA